MEESGLWREPEVGKGAGMAIADAPAELVRQRTTVMAFDAGVEEELCTRSKSCLRTAAELMTPARRPRRNYNRIFAFCSPKNHDAAQDLQ